MPRSFCSTPIASVHASPRLRSVRALHTPRWRRGGVFGCGPLTVAICLFGGVAASGCGTTSVSMVVVRPAVINAQPFGGTVSVAGFAAPRPDFAAVAGQLQQEVQRELLAGVGGVVRVVSYGGGLSVSGRVRDYSMTLHEERKQRRCRKQVVDSAGAGEEKPVKTVDGVCIYRRLRWQARVAVLVRIQASTGQLIYLREVVERRSGRTVEVKDRAPRPPSAHIELRRLRRRIAQRIAHLVVPYRTRVTARMNDCEGAAESLCDSGARAMSQSRYRAAIAAYKQALAVLQRTPGTSPADLAEVHWNLAQVNKYARRYDAAVAELQEARRLDPGHSQYLNELNAVQAARQAHRQLIDQGLVGR